MEPMEPTITTKDAQTEGYDMPLEAAIDDDSQEDQRPITPDIHAGCSYSDSTEPYSPISTLSSYVPSPDSAEGLPRTPASPLPDEYASSPGSLSTVSSPVPQEAMDNQDDQAIRNQEMQDDVEVLFFARSPHNSPPNSPSYSPRRSPYNNASDSPDSVRSIYSHGQRNGFSPGTSDSLGGSDEEAAEEEEEDIL